MSRNARDEQGIQQSIDDALAPTDHTARLAFLRDMLGDWFETTPHEIDRIELLNQIRAVVAGYSPFRDEPVDQVKWVPAAAVQANDYNPNSVAKVEMGFLALLVQTYRRPHPVLGKACCRVVGANSLVEQCDVKESPRNGLR